ncbi:glycine hydroxymethyltransferase [Halanaerobium congolense]|uniref:Glycine hydroxymethyltransferase n=1 Tax=Halanaerobium congolense TaxID=54121 RepID=A0A1G8T843_9FIRM|nr:aminotransferase class I/II-fold pyridoxal phosphate-dependent enzyme [Halanaerobium congolense]PUU87038.1 MAG: glycine/serine hydroxymethyltransferase [Halanaerobium sp.]SDJ37722.1 glycine hydroxymethyltransferase [Halanaerobium congolense]SET87609.1 glycine hydroxymethyltransferase [Halanaerobium congolense]
MIKIFNSLAEINQLLKKHDDYRNNCLNLIASENYINPTVRKYLNSDLCGRYGCYEGLEGEDREYTGNKYIKEIESKTIELVKDIFKADYCDLRAIGGHIAGVASVLALTDPEDLIMEVILENWGHGLIEPMAATVRHFDRVFNVEPIPYQKNQTINTEKFMAEIRLKKPKLIILGSSGMLFPEGVAEIAAVAEEVGAYLIHDSSHISGLIAGGVFPNPLEEGADLMFCSTHKSFPGPQGGIILSNSKEIMQKVNKVMPTLVTSHHINRLPALAAAILEMKKYGEKYGRQIIKNSKALAEELSQKNFNVLAEDRGFTESHLLLMDVSEFGGSYKAARKLESSQILTSDDFGGPDKEIRIGTAEITRRGMKEKDMGEIADFFKRVLIAQEKEEEIINDLERYLNQFNDFSYCLKK